MTIPTDFKPMESDTTYDQPSIGKNGLIGVLFERNVKPEVVRTATTILLGITSVLTASGVGVTLTAWCATSYILGLAAEANDL